MKTVVAKYMPNTWGYADFIRGMSLLWYKLGNKYDIKYSIEHPVREFLSYPGIDIECKDVITGVCRKYRNLNEADDFLSSIENRLNISDTVIANTNFNEQPFDVYDERCKVFLDFKPEYEERFEEYRYKSVKDLNYHAVHIRFKDKNVNWGAYAASAKTKLLALRETCDEEILVVTSNMRFKEHISRLGFRTTPGTTKHIAFVSDFEDIIYTLLDMKLFCYADRVTAYTAYYYGTTGFSKVPSLLYNIPYETSVL